MKNIFLTGVLVSWCLSVLVINCFAQNIDVVKAEYGFDKANGFYKENNYAAAINEYEGVLASGFESGNLYYNLGNAYVKTGDLGRAVLNYERAKVFIPADSDLKANYDYALSVLNLSAPKWAGIFSWLNQAAAGISIDGLSIFLSICLAVFFLSLIFNLYPATIRNSGAGRIIFKKYVKIIIAVGVILLILGSIVFNYKLDYFNKGAIVIVKEAGFRFEPLESATTYFTLEEGSAVKIMELSGAWYKVARPDGKTGWVEKSAVGKLY